MFLKGVNFPKKIIIIKTEGGIGDLLMATPLISTLKYHYPGASIDVMVKPHFAQILEGNTAISEIIPLQPKNKSLFWLSTFFRNKCYDLGILLWSTSKLAWGMFLGMIPIRVGEGNRIPYSSLFSHKVTRRQYDGSEKSHQVEQMLDYARVLGLLPHHNGLVVSLAHPKGREAEKKAASLLEEAGVKPDDAIIGLHIGKGMNLKGRGWPVTNFAKLADLLIDKFNMRVLLTGGEYEIEMASELVKLAKHPIINIAGKTSLLELAAIISHCKLYICPDSGPAHIAAARKVPTISIFALKSDFPARWRPYGTLNEVVRKVTECGRPCIKEKCPDFMCMRAISPQDILPSAEHLLSLCKSALM